MKNKADFLQQIKNSQQFLQKLNNFKKASKQIKDKNKLISHRNIWVKQYKYLTRLQRDQDLENINYFQLFDKYFGFEIQERQVFGKDDYKTYSELLKNSEEKLEVYEVQVWKELKSLPLLINRMEEYKKKGGSGDINVKDATAIVADIEEYLTNQGKIIQQQFNKLNKIQLNVSKVGQLQTPQYYQQQDQFAFLHQLLAQNNYDDVRGFDFESNQLKRIQQGQHHLKQYIEQLSDRLSQDQISSVITQYHHASNLLNQTLQLQLQKLTLDYQEALNLDNQLLSMSQNYQIINHIYNTYLGRGKALALYSQRLAIQFPNVNRKILDRMTQYIEAKIYKGRKSNAVKRNFLREKQQLLQKVQKEVNDRIQTKIRKAQKQAERLQRKEQKMKLEKQIEQLRAQFQKRKAEKQKIVKQEQQKQKQEQRKRDAVRKLYLDQLSKKANQVQQIKQKKQKQQQQKKKTQKQQQQKKLKNEIQQNKPKVQQRNTLQYQKLQKKLQQQKQRKEQPQKAQQRINKAIQKYSFRPNVDFSEQRLNAPTQGMIKRKQTTYDKADKIQLTKMTGYNINQLMGDRRFKLNTMLFQAGLANTDYAREVLNRMSKKPNT